MWSNALPSCSVIVVALVVAGSAFVGPARDVHAQPGDWSAQDDGDRRREIVRRYREILEARPETGAIFDRLVSEVGTGAGLEGLIADYQERAGAQPERIAFKLLAGHLLRRAGRLDEARVTYEAALEQESENVIALRALGGVCGELDDRTASRDYYERALGLADDVQTEREILRELMDLAFEAREWDEAVTYGERLVALEPGNVYTRMELAELFVRHERYDSALEQYDWISSRAGTDTRQRAVAIKDQGDILSLMGRTDEAVERYRQAMALVQPGYWLYREALQRLVDAYRQAGRLPEIVEELEAQWSRPDLAQALILADLFDELGRDEDTEALLRQQVARTPSSLDARLALVRLLERRGAYDEVIEQYLALVRQSPSDANYRFRLVDLYRRIGDREQAVETLTDMARRFSNDPNTLLDVADRFQRFDQDEDALAAFERVVRIDGDNPESLIALGQFHFLQQRRTEAENVWRRILETSLPEAEAHATLADVYRDFSLVEEAVIEQQSAVDLEPANASYRRTLASLFEDAQRLPLALDEWKWVLENASQSALAEESRQAIVRVYERLGRLSDIVEDWAFEVEMSPGDTDAAYLLGMGLTELGRLEDAENAWLGVLELNPDDGVALAALERQYTEQNRISDAIEVISRLAALYPSRAREYYYRLAELSLRQYDDESAVQFAQLAVELNPDDATAQARLGAIFRQMQQYDRAVAAYRQALALDDRAFPFYFELADIYLLQERPRAADELYRVVIAEAREESLVLRAGRRSLRINQAAGTLTDLVGIMEFRLTDAQVGTAQLKLLVEVYESIVVPLGQQVRFGDEAEAEAARVEIDGLGRRALRPMLDALAGEDVLLRRRALDILADLGNGAAVPPVLRFLDDPDIEIRQQAALVVARIADPGSVEVVGRTLSSADGATRTLLVWALMKGGPGAVPVLRELASNSAADDEARALALMGLGLNGVGGGLVENGLMSGRPLVQQAAAIAAGLAQDVELSRSLRQWLMHGAEQTTDAVAWALGTFPFSEDNVALLARGYFAGDPSTRADCGRALTLVGSGAPSADSILELSRSAEFIDNQNMTIHVDRFLLAVRGLESGAEGDSNTDVALVGDTLAREMLVVLGRASSEQLDNVAAQLSVEQGELALRGVGSRMTPHARTRFMQAFVARLVEQPNALVAALTRASASAQGSLLQTAAVVVPRQAGVSAAIDAALTSENAEVRGAGLRAAGWSGDTRYVSEADEAMRAQDWGERLAGVVAYAALGGSVDRLLEIADAEPMTIVKATALQRALMADPAQAWPTVDRAWADLPVSARLGLARTGLEIESLRAVVGMRVTNDTDRAVRALLD
jgi:tetratricopeptide (TPR) repeat protein